MWGHKTSAVCPSMVLLGWAAPQVKSPVTNWDKLAPSLELLKHPAVAESRSWISPWQSAHGDAQAGLVLPLRQSMGAAGPDPAIPTHGAGRAGRGRAGLAADSAPSHCGGCRSAGDPCALRGPRRAGIAPEPIPEAVLVPWGFQCPEEVLVRLWDRYDLGASFWASFIVGGGKGGGVASHCSGGSICSPASQVLPRFHSWA